MPTATADIPAGSAIPLAVTEPVEDLDDLNRKLILTPEIFDEWLAEWDWQWERVSRGEFPPGFQRLRDFQLACLLANPVYWVQAFLREPEDPDHAEPYSLWDYQQKALGMRQHKIYKTAAEVGKTRDIVADSWYSVAANRNGSGLIGAPQQTHLDEIIEAMEAQARWNPALGKLLVRWKKHPHHAFYFANEFKLDFRPSGHDGEAFRGVHARTFAKLDEAAKLHNPRQWSEFWRAVKPGCQVGVYSVPDGRRDTEFYKLGQRARAATRKKEVLEVESFKDAEAHIKSIEFALVQWEKSLMPAPYWSPERKRFFVEQFGGEDSSGYQHNVLGLDGDPEAAVWPWHQLKHAVKDIPEYRAVKVLVNPSADEAIVEVYSTEFVPGNDGPVPRKKLLLDTTFNATAFFSRDGDGETEFRRLIKSMLVHVPGRKDSGGDFGYSPDPTEILVTNVIGRRRRVVARVHMKVVTYDMQCQALDAVDDVYGPLEGTIWGTDLGNAGSAVTHDLHGLEIYEDKGYSDRLRGFMFESTTENVNEDGEPIIDAKTGKPAKITLKEMATDFMTSQVQRQELELPPDPEIIEAFLNHTCKAGARHRIYSKDNDHIIDALRVSELAKLMAGQVEEAFACTS